MRAFSHVANGDLHMAKAAMSLCRYIPGAGGFGYPGAGFGWW